MTRNWRVTGLGVAALILLGLLWPPRRPALSKPRQAWATGFWVWAGASPVESSIQPDILYVQVQSRRWPSAIPSAKKYIAVRRIEHDVEPSEGTAGQIAADYRAILNSAGPDVSLIGLQIDYDSPTRKLTDYAKFLRALREALPPESRLSITALLDWFRDGTNIHDVLDPVDEYVPQFYDAGNGASASEIAQRLDPAKWAPMFNSLGVPYRLGISSFGRIARTRSGTVAYFRDATPLTFALQRDLQKSVTTTGAGELVVQYKPAAGTNGDTVDITFPTSASIRSAYDAARQFGGYCSGVVFFRWPNRGESLALTADEVQSILAGDDASHEPRLETRNGYCTGKQCTDLYLRLGYTPDSKPHTLRVSPRDPLQLFIPEGPLQPFVNRQNQIFVRIPAYSGVRSVYLGRAIAESTIRFEVSVQ